MIEAYLFPGRTLVCNYLITSGIPSVIPAPSVAVAVDVAVAGLTVITATCIIPSGILASIIPSPAAIRVLCGPVLRGVSPGIKGVLTGGRLFFSAGADRILKKTFKKA